MWQLSIWANTGILLAGGVRNKLFQGDPIVAMWQLPGWVPVVSVFMAGIVSITVMNLIDLKLNRHHGRVGAARFRTVVIGDTIVLPIIVAAISYFYHEAGPVGDVWLVQSWTSWIGIFGGFAFTTFIFLPSSMYDPVGDWATVKGGINLWGYIHAIFYWSQSCIYLTFGIKGVGYLVTKNHSPDLVAATAVVALGLLFYFGVLVLLDKKGYPWWYKPAA